MKNTHSAHARQDLVYGIIERQRLNAIFKELFRKSIHICSSFVPLFLKFAYWPVIGLLVLALIAYTVCELLRTKNINIPLISKITEIAARKRDENHFVLGPVTLVCGILLAALLLPLDCARVGIFALAFGDGLAHRALVLVGVGCVDVAVSQPQRLCHGVFRLGTLRHLEDAHAELRHLDSVVERHICLVVQCHVASFRAVMGLVRFTHCPSLRRPS